MEAPVTPDHWDRAARHYEATAHPFTTLFAETALTKVNLGPGDRVLDVAAGTGALSIAAARTGAQVLATDFSPAMVARIAAAGLANIDTQVMDGQALTLPDASFDAVFSIFGVIMFPDWQKGLAEMARVTRAGGSGVVAAWQDQGAATFLLLHQIRRALFPERGEAALPEAMTVLSRPEGLAAAMVAAGFHDPDVHHVTHDYRLDIAALDDPDLLFGLSPDWISLAETEKAAVVGEIRRRANGSDILPVPSTALIAGIS